MPPEPLRVGVVGLGWAGETHARAYARLPGAELVALAGLEEDKRDALAGELGVEHRLSSWEELVALDELDAISVCTPNYLHAPVVIAALERGKHVLCEKPLASTLADAEAMVAAAEASDRVLEVAFNYRERGDVRLLQGELERERLGEIYHVKASWLRRAGIPGIGSWFARRELAGGGPLIDLGVHILDLSLYLLGEPAVQSVSAATHAALGPQGKGFGAWGKMAVEGEFDVEDFATAFLRLEGGRTLLLEAAWACHADVSDEFAIELFGTAAGAKLHSKDYSTRDTLRIYDERDGVALTERPLIPEGEGHLAVLRSFLDAIASGAWEERRGQAGLERARVLEACYESARQGREIELRAAV